MLQPGLVRHQDRVRRLVELVAPGVGRLLAVDEGVTGEAAVGQLLALEQEAHGGSGCRSVAGRHQTGERLVEVAREHLAVGAEVDGLATWCVARADRLPPRAGEGGDHGAGEGLVLAGLQHVGRQPVRRPEPVGLLLGQSREGLRRRVQPLVVRAPGLLVLLLGPLEGCVRRPAGDVDRLGLGRAEAEREREPPVLPDVDLPRLHDIAVERLVVRRGQRAVGVELGQPVAGRAGVPAAGLEEWPVRAQRAEQRDGVVAVRRVRLGVGVGADEGRGRGVHHGVVRATVARPASAVAVDRRVVPDVHLQILRALGRLQPRACDDGVPVGVRDVVSDQPVLPALRGARDPASHPALVGRPHRVRHVPALQVRERLPVGDDVLQGLHVGVVDGGGVDVGQHTAGDGVPDLRAGVTGCAQAVLAGEVEVRQRPRPARRGLGCGRCRRGWRTGRREECQHDRQHEEGQQTTETTPPEHGYSLLIACPLVHPRGAGPCTSRAKRGCLHVRTSRPRGRRPVPPRARIPGARDGSRHRQRDIRRTRRQPVGPQERHADGPPRGAATDRPAGWPRGQARGREGGLHGHRSSRSPPAGR